MKISGGLRQYLEQKRGSGLAFERPETLVMALCRCVGDIELSDVGVIEILGFLDARPTSRRTWRAKYQTLLHFFRFWFYRGALPALLMPVPRAIERQTFVPYIYSRAELRSLLQATLQNQDPQRTVDRRVLRAFIVVLYSTGARVGEMLTLEHKDINLRASRITFRRLSGSREIPIGPHLKEVLRAYLSWRTRQNFQSDYLFVNNRDSPVSSGSMTVNFKRLRGFAKVTRGSGSGQQPRLDDLRFTFAVHRITCWIRSGADLDRMLPALAAYMGQMGLGATERYLAMTPERFRKQLLKLSPTRSRKHWRNDAALMSFLDSL